MTERERQINKCQAIVKALNGELEEKEVARVYEYTQRIWINSTDEKSD